MALSRERRASLWQLVCLMYTITATGAYGLEEVVGGSGPGLTLIILILLPLFWSIPLSLASAELTTMIPHEGGIYRSGTPISRAGPAPSESPPRRPCWPARP